MESWTIVSSKSVETAEFLTSTCINSSCFGTSVCFGSIAPEFWIIVSLKRVESFEFLAEISFMKGFLIFFSSTTSFRLCRATLVPTKATAKPPSTLNGLARSVIDCIDFPSSMLGDFDEIFSFDFLYICIIDWTDAPSSILEGEEISSCIVSCIFSIGCDVTSSVYVDWDDETVSSTFCWGAEIGSIDTSSSFWLCDEDILPSSLSLYSSTDCFTVSSSELVSPWDIFSSFCVVCTSDEDFVALSSSIFVCDGDISSFGFSCCFRSFSRWILFNSISFLICAFFSSISLRRNAASSRSLML